MKTRTWLAAAAFGLAGCNGSGAFAKLQETLGKIDGQQQALMTRMDALEETLGKAAPAAPQRPRQPRKRPNAADTYKVPVGDAYTKGPATAKVTIVEWADFQCGYCNKVRTTLDELKQAYGDDLRIAFKHNPLGNHPQAMPGALAAEAAGKQGKFWEMHDLLFQNGRRLAPELYKEFAQQLGLDVARFDKDMADPGLKKKVLAQQRQSNALAAPGTPAFFINGRFLDGARPTEVFKALIDAELKEADALIAAGTPPAQLYDKVIATGKTKV